MPQLSKVIEVELPSGDNIAVVRRRFGTGSGPRVAIVAGIRGDAPEGIRVAHGVASVLTACEDALMGTVDIYPCANPLAAHRSVRNWPFFDTDLNRLFPGRENGHPPQQFAWALCGDVAGADQVIELRGARPAFSEAPQAHVQDRHEGASELAKDANVALVWKRTPGPAAASTFAHQFPGTVVLEGGTGNRLTPGVGSDLRDGVLHMLVRLGVFPEDQLPFHWATLMRPLVVDDSHVSRIRAARGGLFLPEGEVWSSIEAGDRLGEVVDPVSGDSREVVTSPVGGRLLAIRELPVVFPGTMVARVVEP